MLEGIEPKQRSLGCCARGTAGFDSACTRTVQNGSQAAGTEFARAHGGCGSGMAGAVESEVFRRPQSDHDHPSSGKRVAGVKHAGLAQFSAEIAAAEQGRDCALQAVVNGRGLAAEGVSLLEQTENNGIHSLFSDVADDSVQLHLVLPPVG